MSNESYAVALIDSCFPGWKKWTPDRRRELSVVQQCPVATVGPLWSFLIFSIVSHRSVCYDTMRGWVKFPRQLQNVVVLANSTAAGEYLVCDVYLSSGNVVDHAVVDYARRLKILRELFPGGVTRMVPESDFKIPLIDQ
jgi:hypothetical protein